MRDAENGFFKLLHCICVKEEGSNISALKGGIEVLKKTEFWASSLKEE